MAGEDKDFFGMSDEDFAKVSPSSLGSSEEASASSSASEEEQDDATKQAEEEAANAAAADADAGTGDADANAAPDADADPDADKGAEPGDKAKAEEDLSDEELAKAKPPAGKEPGKDGEKPAAADADKDKSKEAPKAEPVKKDGEKPVVQPAPSSKDMSQEQLAGFYDQVMKPFKANGRDITLRTPEEAIRLMQMGAGYGRKLQEMQPHLKTLRMLEKNDLLDEGKLSYLIDLDKKNPDAIKKLIKDAGIDPLDIDIADNASYKPNNHSVSDNEVAFTETIKEVQAAPGGVETIKLINSTWDQTSKEALWSQPELIRIIQTQRENGVFDQIAAEVDRKKMLGEIAQNVPFLEAYKIAGDALVATKSLILPEDAAKPAPKPAPITAQPKVDQQAGRVLGTRTAAPKSAAPTNDKAKAAASPQSTSRKAKETVNPLDMADDEFLKQFNGRI